MEIFHVNLNAHLPVSRTDVGFESRQGFEALLFLVVALFVSS